MSRRSRTFTHVFMQIWIRERAFFATTFMASYLKPTCTIHRFALGKLLECPCAAAFASRKLQKTGRCHESEIYRQFRRTYAKYRSEEAISDEVLRDMVGAGSSFGALK